MTGRTAILILAHKNPEQLQRLCGALAHPLSDIYISIDARSDIRPFKTLLPGIRFIKKREKGVWGGFSLVKACLNGIEEILSAGTGYDYVHFISGQDYLVLPMEEIIAATEAGYGKQYITWHDISGSEPYHKNMRARYEYYHINHRNRNLSIVTDKAIRILQPRKRRPPAGPVYKGGGWWSLTSDCLRYVLDYCASHPETVRFFEKTHCPDELFFQTIIKASPFAGQMTGRDMRYVDWSAHGKSPEILTVKDFDRIVSGGDWFARKFDTGKDSKILDMVDGFRKDKTRK